METLPFPAPLSESPSLSPAFVCDIAPSDNGVILKKAGSPVQPEDIPQAGTVIRVTAFGKGCYAGTGDTAASVSGLPSHKAW